MKCLDFHQENWQAYQSGELDCLVLHVLCCVFKQEFQNNMREVTDFGLQLLGSVHFNCQYRKEKLYGAQGC